MDSPNTPRTILIIGWVWISIAAALSALTLMNQPDKSSVIFLIIYAFLFVSVYRFINKKDRARLILEWLTWLALILTISTGLVLFATLLVSPTLTQNTSPPTEIGTFLGVTSMIVIGATMLISTLIIFMLKTLRSKPVMDLFQDQDKYEKDGFKQLGPVKYAIPLSVVISVLVSIFSTTINAPSTDVADQKLSFFTIDMNNIITQQEGTDLQSDFVLNYSDWYFSGIVETINKKQPELLLQIVSLRSKPLPEFVSQMKAIFSAYQGNIKGGKYIDYDHLGKLGDFDIYQLSYSLRFNNSENRGKMRLYFMVNGASRELIGFDVGPTSSLMNP